jgi:hypothetical protein
LDDILQVAFVVFTKIDGGETVIGDAARTHPDYRRLGLFDRYTPLV